MIIMTLLSFVWLLQESDSEESISKPTDDDSADNAFIWYWDVSLTETLLQPRHLVYIGCCLLFLDKKNIFLDLLLVAMEQYY
jgi:hypothetical protein